MRDWLCLLSCCGWVTFPSPFAVKCGHVTDFQPIECEPGPVIKSPSSFPFKGKLGGKMWMTVEPQERKGIGPWIISWTKLLLIRNIHFRIFMNRNEPQLYSSAENWGFIWLSAGNSLTDLVGLGFWLRFKSQFSISRTTLLIRPWVLESHKPTIKSSY